MIVKVEYLIKWRGFDDPKEDTWEPLGEISLFGCTVAPGFSTIDPYWPSLVFPGSLKGAADEAIKKFEKENATEGCAKKVTTEKN